MAVSDDIFQLVKVMNRKETAFFRRYFMLHSAGKEGAMLELFEKLILYAGANESYDEGKLKKQLSTRGIKHFPVVKNNLYKLLLKSLHEFNGEPANEDKVKNLVEQHDLLFSKSLLKQSRVALMKAKKIAVKNEMFAYVHDILNRERILSRYMLDAVGYEETVLRVHSEQMRNLEQMKNLADLNDLGSKFIIMMQKYPTAKVRDDSIMKEMNDVLNSPLLADESGTLSGTALRRLYNLKLVAADWNKNYREQLEYAVKYAEHTERDAYSGKGTIHEYIISLNAVITAAIRMANMDEYEKAYEKLSNLTRHFPDLTERDELESRYMLGLSVFSSSADNYHPERGEAMLKEAELNLKQFEKELSIHQKIVWYFVIARMCFCRGSYQQAGRWLNRLIAIPNIDVSQDYQCYARIMNLIVAYESGNPDSIEHALRMTYYFLTKRNKVYQYEKIILQYTRESFRVKTEKEINEMLELMHNDLTAIFDDPFEENAFDAFNPIPWLVSKIKNIPIIEAMKNRK
jgi:hypothetical protein